MKTSFESFLIDKLGEELDSLKREYQEKTNLDNAEIEIREIVEAHVGDIFVDVAELFNLETGDVTPAQDGEISVIEDRLVSLILDWYADNNE